MRLAKAYSFVLALALALGAAPLAAQDTAAAQGIDQVQATSSKADKLRKLQIVNRAYQVSLGRGLKREESKKLLPMTRYQITKSILESDELTTVFGQRLVAFAEGGESGKAGSNVAASRVPSGVRQIARPTDKLDEVLKKLAKNRHKGAQCGEEKSSVCFARWLVGRVAPTLGLDWVKQHEAEMTSWSYARLLEQITMASI